MKQNHKQKEILFLKNVSRENPGLLEDIIKEHGIEYSVVDLSLNESIRPLDNYGAVVVLGGPDSANDKTPKMEKELALIRNILDAKIPYLGICLGLQTLVKASGGEVVKSETKEIGFRDQNGNNFKVELTESGREDILFKGLGNSLTIFQLHGETVVLTEDMKLLATGKFCRNQVVKAGPTSYGIQCHFELTREMLEIWMSEDTDLKELDKDQMRSDFEKNRINYAQTARQLFLNFLRIAGFQ
jgi:GMP synthase (glutamine-hydrolysing)